MRRSLHFRHPRQHLFPSLRRGMWAPQRLRRNLLSHRKLEVYWLPALQQRLAHPPHHRYQRHWLTRISLMKVQALHLLQMTCLSPRKSLPIAGSSRRSSPKAVYLILKRLSSYLIGTRILVFLLPQTTCSSLDMSFAIAGFSTRSSLKLTFQRL